MREPSLPFSFIIPMNIAKLQYLYSTSVEESFNRFFKSLTTRVTTLLKLPTSMDQAYVFPANIIDGNPILMSNMFMLLRLTGANIRNHIVRTIVARKLLIWLIKERPDIVNEMLQN